MEKQGDTDPAVLKEQVADLRKAVDEAAGQVRSLTFLFLTVGLYIGVIGGTTTPRMLLMGDLIQLPILNVGVSITWAYSLAPILLLMLHYWLLAALLSLARRIDRFNDLAGRLDGRAERHQRALVTAFSFVEWRAGNRHGALSHAAAGVLNWLIYVGAPVALFLWIQLRSYLTRTS